ncbi:hypothetical protein F2Q70_00001681 [Brassica cretica]|uniref:Uncharacterized protein n=1 Tax=Brassica cretica TaxID=69181 RepID=A0A8S9IZL7_BRACR|nr:hypothetical protein F2Q70_00001681 [Brassica cretica]KAF3563641.1 hypothetical protein DY000_02012770 [Brassica cretica]
MQWIWKLSLFDGWKKVKGRDQNFNELNRRASQSLQWRISKIMRNPNFQNVAYQASLCLIGLETLSNFTAQSHAKGTKPTMMFNETLPFTRLDTCRREIDRLI